MHARSCKVPFALAALGVVIVLGSIAYAELPPGSYDKLRADAEEAVIIEVTAVTAKTSGAKTSVRVEAKLLGVERSKAKLKSGQRITIDYQSIDIKKTRGFAGPRQAPILKQGGVYPAFLNKVEDKAGFELAAYGASFEMTPEKSRGEP